MIAGVRAKAIRVCGYPHKESLKFALFYLDSNTTALNSGIYSLHLISF